MIRLSLQSHLCFTTMSLRSRLCLTHLSTIPFAFDSTLSYMRLRSISLETRPSLKPEWVLYIIYCSMPLPSQLISLTPVLVLNRYWEFLNRDPPLYPLIEVLLYSDMTLMSSFWNTTTYQDGWNDNAARRLPSLRASGRSPEPVAWAPRASASSPSSPSASPCFALGTPVHPIHLT